MRFATFVPDFTTRWSTFFNKVCYFCTRFR